MAHGSIDAEFDRQVGNLIQMGYPGLAGVSDAAFLGLIEPLRGCLTRIDAPSEARIPFVIVMKHDVVAAEAAMPLVKVKGKDGMVGMYPVAPEGFNPIDGVRIPGGAAYLLADIDTGRATLNVTPGDALGMIRNEGRSPLTIDEGVAIVTHFPEVLTDRDRFNCFSMLGSRCGDKRVPALWISEGRPRLGWCWAGNPHTWLGSASCMTRVGVDEKVIATA